jgi:cyclic beta-1,2-glucan synthetase
LEEPIRAELFGVERLKPHADSLAAAQVVFSKPRPYPLLTPRVLENGRVLLECYRIIARAIQQEHVICCCPPLERKQAGDGHCEDQSGYVG